MARWEKPSETRKERFQSEELKVGPVVNVFQLLEVR